MSEEPRRRRAPAMSPEDRREAIVHAALPLVIKDGTNVTTSQIAAAAGIAEGTVFRVFKDKQELLATCVSEALKSDVEIERIRKIDHDQPLNARLTESINAVREYLDRMWGVMSALRDTGYQPPAHKLGEEKGPPLEMRRLSEAVAELFADEPVRVKPEHAARLFLGLVFTNRMQGRGLGEVVAEPTELVELFLHGALKRGGNDE
ncbi:TetR family transcriptional regulator [Lentzea sp. NBRC 105346]|uniref:TetR/AcrR family transcriptional regulator n=1 Tax=Lentzea sp. NBRC 105346 TaxID=3032205 RepID=UPI0024A0385D|nr:TetR family transcriptional regulator [Lentzea sp. NBRC 105346]GLZ34967.1 TetR family transcriptional regulator [Lentzea sp. NBRC 105346]